MHSREQEIFALMVERDHWKKLAEDAINGPPAAVTRRSPLDPDKLNLMQMKAAEIERDRLKAELLRGILKKRRSVWELLFGRTGVPASRRVSQ